MPTRTTVAIYFLYLVCLLFVVVVGYQMVIGLTPNVIAVSFITLIVGYTINNIGVQHGVNVVTDAVATRPVQETIAK